MDVDEEGSGRVVEVVAGEASPAGGQVGLEHLSRARRAGALPQWSTFEEVFQVLERVLHVPLVAPLDVDPVEQFAEE